MDAPFPIRRSRIVQTLNVEEEFRGGPKRCRGFSVRQDPFQWRTAHTKCGLYLHGPSLAAALPAERRVLARRGWAGEKSELFEHPAWSCLVVPHMRGIEFQAGQHCFAAACFAKGRACLNCRSLASRTATSPICELASSLWQAGVMS
jgi:hypothetical protein